MKTIEIYLLLGMLGKNAFLGNSAFLIVQMAGSNLKNLPNESHK